MTKKILIMAILINLLSFFYSEELSYKITEKKGSADIKFKEGDWKKAEVNQSIPNYSEIITGYNSQLTIEITQGNYITINQLSHIKINEEEEKFECCITNIKILRGFIMAYSKRETNQKNKIFVYMENGSVEFNESSGEIYLREDKGSFIKAYGGKVKIYTKNRKHIYNLKKDELCAFLPNGSFLDTDYFLRRDVIIKPNNLIDPQGIIAYYDQLFQYYTNNPKSNDYNNNFRP